MSNTVICEAHGERSQTFVCNHLMGVTSGLGFNRDEPSEDNPFPDAWCDNCELIRAEYGGWNDESQALSKISLLCSACYQRAKIRNTRTVTTLDDLKSLRWKCGSCDEWHSGACLDFGYHAPQYWSKENDKATQHYKLSANWQKKRPETLLTKDYCAIENRYFFVRGIIEVPIIGTDESLRWGVWGSLSGKNFETLLDMDGDPAITQLPAMFSWMSTNIREYPNTINLKMYARVPDVKLRPCFELELTDHPLSQEYHNGITPERVKEIMLGRLANVH